MVGFSNGAFKNHWACVLVWVGDQMSQFAWTCPGFSISGNAAVLGKLGRWSPGGEFLTPKRGEEQEMVPWPRKGGAR